MKQRIISVDPGREKCGLAVAEREESEVCILYKAIIPTSTLADKVTELAASYAVNTVVVGDRTTSKAAVAKLQAFVAGGKALMIVTVSEHRSTDEARARYWRENPPRGWRRWLPVTMMTPPGPVDDWVAVILAERYFRGGGNENLHTNRL